MTPAYLLLALLILNVVLHTVVVARFGIGNANAPFLVFAIIDAVLAILVGLAVPYAIWATLLLSAFGLTGLTVTFHKPPRDKTLDRVIWVVDALVVLNAAYLLFLAH